VAVALGCGLFPAIRGARSRVAAVTYSAVILLVLVVATLTSLIPAARAAFVELMRVLRDE
jgi:hypothetical protein